MERQIIQKSDIMGILKENEWRVISDILLDLYYQGDIRQFEESFLNHIKALIPYDQGNFRFVHPATKLPIQDKAVFINTPKEMIPIFYAHVLSDKNYLKSFFLSPHSVVFVDSNVLEDELRMKTPFYLSYLKPQKLPYSCGISLVKDGLWIGVISFFRSEMWGDFNDREIFILDILKDHLVKIGKRLIGSELPCRQDMDYGNKLDIEKIGLTTREKEVYSLIINGYTNEQISGELNIAGSTTKKHIYNIFNKCGVNNRLGLIKLTERNRFI